MKHFKSYFVKRIKERIILCIGFTTHYSNRYFAASIAFVYDEYWNIFLQISTDEQCSGSWSLIGWFVVYQIPMWMIRRERDNFIRHSNRNKKKHQTVQKFTCVAGCQKGHNTQKEIQWNKFVENSANLLAPLLYVRSVIFKCADRPTLN